MYYLDRFEPEDPDPPSQPRCACGCFLPWKHTATRQPVAGVTQYVWTCRACGAANMLVEDVQAAADEDLPF